MTKGYRTVMQAYTECRFTEKKSEFITYVARVEDEAEAKLFIDSIRKQHPNATHNVFAYVLKDTGIARASDDGEPSGTAGAPVLEALKREDLCGVCIVVTRYFGGILLGAGGLVRAYARAAANGIEKAGCAEFVRHTTFEFCVSYGDYEKILRELGRYSCLCSDTKFTDNVTFSLSCEDEKLAAFETFIADTTNGKCKCKVTGTTFAPKA